MARRRIVPWLLLLAGCQQGEIPLCQLFHDEPWGALLGPRDQLTAPSTTPYMAGGWEYPPGAWPQARAEAHLRLYCRWVQEGHLRLEGQDSSGPRIEVRINDRVLAGVRLDRQIRSFDLEVPTGFLNQGPNDLVLSGSRKTTRWSSVHFGPAQPGAAFDGGIVGSRVDSGDLCLPFGRCLEVPFQAESRAVLKVAEILPWVQPGAPGARGELRVRLSEGKWHQEYTLQPGRGSLLPLDLPDSKEGFNLSLLACSTAELKPGQLGLRLRGASLRGASPPTPPQGEAVPASATRSRPPNVVFYLVDTLRADHLSCYGQKPGLTPRMDALAADGVRFQNVTAQSCWTKPSVASIFTSLPPVEHACQDFGSKLVDSLDTLPECFQRAGYRVQGVVTNVYVKESFGYAQGFDEYKYLGDVPAGTVQKELSTWLRGRPLEPFFLYVHTLDPHSPYQPPPEFLSKPAQGRVMTEEQLRQLGPRSWTRPPAEWQPQLELARRLYADEVHYSDYCLGSLIDTLKELKLYDDTLIVVTSDHGEELLEHGLMGHNTSLYQELLEVPWILKLPKSQAAGTVVRDRYEHLDMAPTVLYHAGLAIPQQMRGCPFVPGRARPACPGYFSVESGHDLRTYHPSLAPYEMRAQGVRHEDWVYIETLACSPSRLQPIELFDLRSDPHEWNNLAYERPEVRARLARLLHTQPLSARAATRVDREELKRHFRELPYLR